MKPVVSQTQSWAEKYRPTKSSQVVGNIKNVFAFKKWVQHHKERRSNVGLVALLHGPPGIGKTSMAHAILKEYGFNVCEVNASLERTKKSIQQTLDDVVTRVPLVGRTAVILDEIDGGIDNSDGAADGVLSFMKWVETSHIQPGSLAPIVCIANEVFGKSMQRLVHSVFTLRFFHPFASDLNDIFMRIVQKENVKIAEKDKNEIIHQCGGDVRRLLTMLESFKLGSTSRGNSGSMASFIRMSVKDTFMTNFSITKHVLVNDKMKFDASLALMQSDQSLIANMIQENYVNIFTFQSGDLQTITEESVDVISRMSDLADDLSSLDLYNQSTESYQDDHEDARFISASWLNASIRCHRTSQLGRQKRCSRLPHIDKFQIQSASCYSRQNQLKSNSAQFRYFESSSLLGQGCGFVTQIDINTIISLFAQFHFNVLKEILPNIEETNWNALVETREQICKKI